MQISSSTPSLNTLRLSFTSESQRESLLGSLREGQTIQARVVDELSTGRWAIRFMGHTLIAESRLALRPGQVVDTRVHEVGPPLMLSISGRPGSESAAVITALQQLGLEADAPNHAILSALIRNGLPVERQEVQALREFLTALGNSPLLDDLDELIDRILFLRSKGVPVTPDTLTAFWSSAPSGTLGALFEGLTDLMRALDRRVGERTRANVADVLRVLSEAPDSLDAEGVKQLLKHLGIDLESRIASGKPIASLKAVLLELLSAGSNLTPGEQDQLSDLVRFLNTLQASSLPGEGSDPLTFQIPIVNGQTMSTADIQISRGGKNGSIDPKRLSLSISVTLSALGRVRIDLSSYNGLNTCGVNVENQKTLDWMDQDADALKEALERSGYPVPDIRFRVETEGPTPSVVRPTIGVDFKA